MKRIYNILFIALLAAVTSCKMDLTPSTAIVQGEAFQTMDDAKRFANGLNTKYRNCFYGIFAYTTEIQTEMFNASLEYGNRNGSPHRMDGSFTASDYNLRDVWRTSYQLILNANNVIANIDLIPVTTDGEKADLAKYKGWAYFYRAAIYHDLVRRFAVDYEPTTANTELGVPIVLDVDLNAKPSRNTIAAVYDQISKDIVEAKKYLTPITGVAGSITPTIDAVKALEARVALYKHDYATAATLSSNLITSGKYTLATDQEEMNAEWIKDSGKECILQMFMDINENAVDWNNVVVKNNIYLGYSQANKKYIPDFIPTLSCINMYESNDLRRTTWFKTLTCYFDASDVNLVLFAKYWGNPDYETAPARAYKQRPKVFRLGELYLINAEANAMNNNEPAAKTSLNALQALRNATQTSGTMDNIKQEWAKEMIGEGYRIDCFRRWKIGFNGRIPQNNITVYQGEYFTEKKADAATLAFTWGIPDSERNVNPNLVQNKGW